MLTYFLALISFFVTLVVINIKKALFVFIPSSNSTEDEKRDLYSVQNSQEEYDRRKDEILAIEGDSERKTKILDAIEHAWRGYKEFAFGHDDFKPISRTSNDWLGQGLTIVDSLDTLWLAGMKEEFYKGRDWVRDELDFDLDKEVSVFETTIRVLGGLLSAFDLSGERVFLLKAKDLADRLIKAYDTPSGFPYVTINLKTGRVSNPGWTGMISILSEGGTSQLEFAYLSYHLNDSRYVKASFRVLELLDSLPKKMKGLYPLFINVYSGQFTTDEISIGALGDSFYEYPLKLWILTGKQNPRFRRMYNESVFGMEQYLMSYSRPSNLLYLSEYHYGEKVHIMHHLVCFTGALFALGANTGRLERQNLEMFYAEEITRTCRSMYQRTPTGLSPEYVDFENYKDFISGAQNYVLRPETVESYFYLWRYTHNPIYKEYAWELFASIETHCKVEHGYSGVKDVFQIPTQKDDNQPSFFIAETLKYLLLIFENDSAIPLDKYVFNTEAHPLSLLPDALLKWEDEGWFTFMN